MKNIKQLTQFKQVSLKKKVLIAITIMGIALVSAVGINNVIYNGSTNSPNKYMEVFGSAVKQPVLVYKTQYGVATGDGISIRTGAGTKYSWQGSFALGTQIKILGTAGSFYKVSYSGITGYVSNQYVKLTGKPGAPTVQALTGYIIDKDCFNTNSNPGNDTKPCLQMKSCAASGYGIGVQQSDGTYKFYFFDGEFSPKATGTQVKAKDLIDKSIKNTHISISIKGILNGDTKTVDGVKYPVITVSSLVEAPEPTPITIVAPKVYEGWLSDSNNAKNVSDPTKITKASLVNNDYGILIAQPDNSFKFYKFDVDGQKLAKETILDKTVKEKDLRIKVNGILDENKNTIKISTIQEEQELVGIVLTENTFKNSSDPTAVKRDDIVAAESVASGYGIAIKQTDGKYKFYKFDDNGNKSAKSLLSWYVNWAGNISSIPVLVQGAIDGDNITTSKVIRERYIPGQLASKKLFDDDKALKDITRADLLTDESVASGYGYYVHSCGGHEYFPFDKDSNELIKKFVENSVTQGEIKVIPKGFWYNVGNTIKITSITEDFNAETTPETPVDEELSGLVATRNYFKGSEYQKLGVPGTITKDFLLVPENATSGYGIIYKTCCGFGYLRFDENGTKLIKDIINKSQSPSNLNVIVSGKRDADTIYVTSIIEANDKTYSGTLDKTDKDGYGIKVKQDDGTYKFYKLDSKGSYYHSSGQSEAKSLLTSLKKDTTTVDVKGTLDGDTLVVSSIEENLSSTQTPVVLNNITITKAATKLTYTVGDKLDIAGLQVTGNYSDNTKTAQAITSANITGFDSSKPATNQTLTITYGGKTVAYTINIVAPVPKVLTFQGYIQDEDCFIGYAPDFGSDTKGCLLMHACANSGYGITALESNGTFKYYYFDGKFSTFADKKTFDGTGSQLTSWNLATATTKKNHVTVKVIGILNGETKVSPYDGISYPVITVTSLEEIPSNLIP